MVAESALSLRAILIPDGIHAYLGVGTGNQAQGYEPALQGELIARYS